jgi:YVTN family beta-propeller protein
VALTPDGSRAYVTNHYSSTVSVIDTATNTVTATVSVGTGLGGVAVTPDGSRAYVVNFVSNTVSVIDTNPGGNFFSVAPGGSVISTGTGPLITLDTSTLTLGGALVLLRGRRTATATEVADGVTLTLGTDQPLQLAGTLVELSGATVTAQRGVRVDTALLAASAPLLDLKASSTLTTALAAVDLSFRAKVTSLGPVLRLDASTLTVTNGAAINVTGGSLLKVTGDLLALTNGSTLTVSNGALLSVSGNSVVNVSGALAAFGGTGSNHIRVTNTLCSGACTVLSGISVFLTGGATASNVTLGPNPIKNPSLGGIVRSNSSTTAVISVSGASSKVTITAP